MSKPGEMGFFKSIKYLFKYGGMPSFEQWQKENYLTREQENKKNKEIWHYECENGHKWKSYSSPRGTYVYGESGQTRCPICGTPICRGEVYINGKLTAMGAVHVGFLTKEKPKRKYKKRKKK